VFTSYLKLQWAYRPTLFLELFIGLTNTMVKEPFMKIIFDLCQQEDPNGGIDIFFFLSHLSFFRVFRPQTGHGQIRPR